MNSILQKLIHIMVQVVSAGIALRLILVLYEVHAGRMTLENAKIKVGRLLKVLLVVIALPSVNDIVLAMLMSGTDSGIHNTEGNAYTILENVVRMFKAVIEALMKIDGAITLVRFIVKLIELSKAPSDEQAALKKQAVNIVVIGAAILTVLSVIRIVIGYFGIKFV